MRVETQELRCAHDPTIVGGESVDRHAGIGRVGTRGRAIQLDLFARSLDTAEIAVTVLQ